MKVIQERASKKMKVIQERAGSLGNQQLGYSNHQKHNCMSRMKAAYEFDHQPTELPRRLSWLSQMEAKHYTKHKDLLVHTVNRQPTTLYIHSVRLALYRLGRSGLLFGQKILN